MSKTLNERKTEKTTPLGFTLGQRTYGTRSSYASIVYFHYDRQNFGSPTNTGAPIPEIDVTGYTRGIIEDDIADIKVSKTISASSATFSVSLLPSKNWKKFLSPGDWVLIYLDDKHGVSSRYAGDAASTKNLVMIGSIDRISKSLQKNEDSDKVELKYTIAGRNFGKVFEETDVWFDPYSLQRDELNYVILPNAGVELAGGPSDMTEKFLDVFLGGGAEFPAGRTTDLNNWKLPLGLAAMLGANTKELKSPKFYDILQKKIEPNLPGFKARQMLTLNSNGSLHDTLARCSNDLVNELYYEEARSTDGSVKPTIFLKNRPINTPFLNDHIGTDAEAAAALNSLNGKTKTIQDLAVESFIEISPSEIIYENLGKDDHSRFNLFWLKPINGYEDHFAYASNNNATKGISNPTFLGASIERHGLKRYDQVLEFCHTGGTGKNQAAGVALGPQILLWKAFMIQLYDMHFANHLYEAGTIECTGVLEAELGKALIVKSENVTTPDKVYFIEGYEHSWSFPNKWTTVFTLTHGQFKVDTGKHIFIDASADDFGQEDTTTSSVYVAKTLTSKEERT